MRRQGGVPSMAVGEPLLPSASCFAGPWQVIPESILPGISFNRTAQFDEEPKDLKGKFRIFSGAGSPIARSRLAEAAGYGFLPGMQSKEPERSGTKPINAFRFRRIFLFVATLLTLVLVFLGAVPYHQKLSLSAVRFTVFWAGVFVLAAAVLALAIYDLARVRRDHQMRVRDLEKELAAAAADARELMRRQAELERDDPESNRP